MRSAALITGGAKRIGREIALFLASIGFDIALHYRSSEREAGRALAQIEGLGVTCSLFRADLSSGEDLKTLLPSVMKKFPRLSLLVNNASIFTKATIAETTDKLFDDHVSINLRAPYFLSRDFAGSVKGGSIINVLDTRIESSRSTYAAYSIAKKGLAELTRMAAIEFSPQIRVNAIAPGLILPPEGETDRYLERLAKDIPLKRKGSLENIKSSVKFLLENDFITGQIIFCDGGEHLKR